MKKIIILFLFFGHFFYSQGLNIENLEKEINKNNRLGEHQLSQKKLLFYLDQQNLNYRERIKINLLMAATFRSLKDYTATIRYLKISQEISNNLDEGDSLKINIAAEMAFAYFDSNNYKESERIIQEIERKNYLNLDEARKAYIIMQQGYINFLNEKYSLAEKEYRESLLILKKTSACNQPAVLVKQMQLYSANNQLEKVNEIYKECLMIADSCKILKYKIYAAEEIQKIYRNHNNKDEYFFYDKVLDSLNNIYSREGKLSHMHAEKDAYLEQKQVRLKKISTVTIVISIIIFICLVIFGIYFYRRVKFYKQEKGRLIEELELIKEELRAYSLSHFSDEMKKNDNLNFQNLSKRQKDLLYLISEGYTNKEIAEKLYITESTVKYHIRNLYSILDIKNRKEILIRMSRKE